MLEYFRQNLLGKVGLALLGLIALSFVFVGLNYNLTGNAYAAKVDGATIGIAAFETEYRSIVQQNPQIAAMPAEFRAQVRRSILDQLVLQQVVDNYLVDAGIQITDADLTAAIRNQEAFQLDGVFDMDTYLNALAIQGLDPDRYEAGVRLQLRQRQLEAAIRGSAILSPGGYRRILNLMLEERLVTTATLDAETVAAEIDVTEEQVAAYYENNPTLYQLPETADVEYLEIRRSEVAGTVSIDEADLADYYERNKDRFEQDERRQARHILILDEDGAEARANDLAARINAGESFEELAAENSADTITASMGGDLGALTEEMFPEAIAGDIFAMEPGEVRGPIQGDFGYHIVRLDEVLESGPLPFEQVRPTLMTEMQDEQAEGLFLSLERRLSDALFDATDIAGLAAASGLDVKTAAGITREGGEPFTGAQAALDAIFDPAMLASGTVSDMIEIDADRTVVIAVTNHQPATRQALDDVRETILSTVTQQQSEALMAERAQQMQDAVAGGEDFATAAAAIGATVSAPTSLKREQEDADQFLLAAVFAAAKPATDAPTLGSVRNGVGGYTIYRLDAVLPGRPESVPLAERDMGKLQMADTYGLGELGAFVQSLRGSADVVINEDALAAPDLLQ